MLHARILYIAALLGALLFHTYYTGWFSWYLLMLAVLESQPAFEWAARKSFAFRRRSGLRA